MSQEHALKYMSSLNLFWDGKPQSFDRRTTESFTVRDARLTVGLQVQLKTIQDFFERTNGLSRGIGFLARFLFAWPQSTSGTRFYQEPPATMAHRDGFNRKIRALLEGTPEPGPKGETARRVLALSADAKRER